MTESAVNDVQARPLLPAAWAVPWRFPALTALVIALADQTTKWFIIGSDFLRGGGHHIVIPRFFHLVYVENTGAAWGIMRGRMRLLALLSLVVLTMLVVFYRRFTAGWLERAVAVSLIMGGIIGNVVDRLFRAGVVDFLHFYIGKYEWPSFNIADSAICVGVGIYLLSSFVRPEPVYDPPEADLIEAGTDPSGSNS